MNKTLYISDLDGTLLNSSQKISKYTAKTINRISQKGIIFSYATARSSGTAGKVTTNISANIPVIIYNGCFIIDQIDQKILYANYFSKDDYCKIYEDLQLNNVNPIVYSYINGVEKFSYIKNKINSQTQEFLNTRKGDIRENQVENLSISIVQNPFYFTCIADEKTLQALFEKYKDKFSCVFHKDIYLNSYWLEIMPYGVNKANAIDKLKEILNCDYVIAFGDAKNDIQMFEYADESYAVKNADEELKKIATDIIESNDNDGVAKWINNNVTMPKDFWISDLHFGHKNVLKFDGRPFSTIEEMDKCMIELWNSVVSKEDTVRIIGDVAYRSELGPVWYLKQLNGKKILIIGNHDQAYLDDSDFCECFDQITYLDVCESDDKLVASCHYPIAEWYQYHRGAWHIYGHIHNNSNDVFKYMCTRGTHGAKALNAGACINNYIPVTIEQMALNNELYLNKINDTNYVIQGEEKK